MNAILGPEELLFNVTTRIGELKTHSLIMTRLRQAIAAQDFSFFVIFPTRHLLQEILHEFLSQPENPGFGGRPLLLFQGFQDEVCGLLGVQRRLPSPLTQELLITQCFRQLNQEGKLPLLGGVPFTRHYRQAILEGITEWNRSGLTSEIFQSWVDGKDVRLGNSFQVEKNRLQELSLLYSTYQKLLIQKGFTSDDLILKELKGQPSPVRKQGSVILYGFTDLTPLQFKYFEALAPWFTLEFIVDPTPVPEFQILVSRSFSILPGIPAPEGDSSPPATNALSYLQQNLWVEPNQSRAVLPGDSYGIGCDSVRLIQTAGAARTATAIAREIVDLFTVHPKYQWDDVLIISPEPLSFSRTALPVFREYGLPLSVAPTLLKEVPCISHWYQAITTVSGNWSWPEMEILIRQSYRGSQASLGDRVLLEITREYGALSGRERWLGIIQSDGFARYFVEIGLNIQPLLEKVAWLTRIPDTAPLQDYIALTLEWLRDFGVSKNELPFFEESIKERMADSRGAQFFQAAVLELFHFTRDLSGFGEILPVAEFGQFMLDYLLTREINGPDQKRTGLRVISPREVRGLTARVVFMTGLEEGIFPGIYINDWKINNLERQELAKRGIHLETGAQYQLQEKWAFYWGLQAATQRLYLVVRDQDDNAQPLNRSSFLEEVLKWLPELALEAAPTSLAPSLPESFDDCKSGSEYRQYWAYYLTTNFNLNPASNLKVFPNKDLPDSADEPDPANFSLYFKKNLNVLAGTRFKGASGKLSGEEAKIHQGFLEDDGYRALAFQIEQWRQRLAGPSTPRPFFTQPGSWKLLAKIFHPEYTFAITALEEFRKCPYRFYFRHLLKVRPLLKPQLFPSALDLGDLYHQILEAFGDNYREQSLFPENQGEYHKYLDECFQSFFREWLENAPSDSVKLILWLKAKEIQRNLANWLGAELQQSARLSARFRMKYLELAFGLTKGDCDPGSTPQPFSCEYEDQKVSLWGKVDRVDQDFAGNFIVYDYKSGKTPSIQGILKLENLQLPVYIMALEQLYFGADQAVGASYLGLRHPARNRSGVWRQAEPPPKTKILTEEDWQEWLANVRRVLVETANAIFQGEFGRRAEKCFSFCEFGDLCHRQAGEEGSPNDARTQPAPEGSGS